MQQRAETQEGLSTWIFGSAFNSMSNRTIIGSAVITYMKKECGTNVRVEDNFAALTKHRMRKTSITASIKGVEPKEDNTFKSALAFANSLIPFLLRFDMAFAKRA